MSIHACCTGWRVPLSPSPSIVVISFPSTEATGVTQDVMGVPPTRTMHAPHWDIPHPNFVPVSPRSSRRANWRVTPSTSGRVYSVPLTESFALVISVFLSPSRGPRGRAPDALHVSLAPPPPDPVGLRTTSWESTLSGHSHRLQASPGK